MRRKGVVVALSGGVDSAVVAALSVRALGAERVLALLMPERASEPGSVLAAQSVADALGITTVLEDVGPALDAIGCSRRQEQAVRRVLPEVGPGYRFKLWSPPLLAGKSSDSTRLTVQAPCGKMKTVRLDTETFCDLVAATHYKQRVRKTIEYFHADRLHYAVAGAANRLECELGFFANHGADSADLLPIAHLYASQILQLAEVLDLPDDCIARSPAADLFSLGQTQEELYFTLPPNCIEICSYALDHGIHALEVAALLGLDTAEVARLSADIVLRRAKARRRRQAPRLSEASSGEPMLARDTTRASAP